MSKPDDPMFFTQLRRNMRITFIVAALLFLLLLVLVAISELF